MIFQALLGTHYPITLTPQPPENRTQLGKYHLGYTALITTDLAGIAQKIDGWLYSVVDNIDHVFKVA